MEWIIANAGYSRPPGRWDLSQVLQEEAPMRSRWAAGLGNLGYHMQRWITSSHTSMKRVEFTRLIMCSEVWPSWKANRSQIWQSPSLARFRQSQPNEMAASRFGSPT